MSLILICLLLFSVCVPAYSVGIGDIIYEDGLRTGQGWSSSSGIFFEPSGVRIVVTPEIRQSRLAVKAMGNRDLLGDIATTRSRSLLISRSFSLLERYRNYELEFSVEAKSYGIARPKVPWEGVRFVMTYDTRCLWYSECCNGHSGTFDWRRLTFKTRVPMNLTKGTLSLGIIGDCGEILFRDLRIRVVGLPLPSPVAYPSPAPAGHQLGRLRGMNTGPGLIVTERKAVETFRAWPNCNLYKYTINDCRTGMSDQEFDEFCERSIYSIERFLYFVKKHTRALAVIQLAGFREKVGDTQTHASALLKTEHDRNIEFWRRVARHFRGEKAIWAFELYNEMEIRVTPVFDYPDLMETISRMINEIDPERWIIVQQEAWWGQRSMDRLRPIKAKNIIYGIHHYNPFLFSHQGLSHKTRYRYPGIVDGWKWDKAMLREDFEPVRQFQLAYHVPIFVSEFCCISWAEGGGQWTRDCIELFEEFGWDWMWHALAEFGPWDPHMDGNLHRVSATDRSRVLSEYMAKNRFPARFKAVKPALPKYGPVLYEKKDVQRVMNYKAWNSVSLFTGNFDRHLQLGFGMHFLRSHRGFGSVKFVGERSSCMVLVRPHGVSWVLDGGNETGFRQGGVSVPLREWGYYDIIVSDGMLKVSANGKYCGEIPFVPGELTQVYLSGYAADLEVREVELRNLAGSSGQFRVPVSLPHGGDVELYRSVAGQVIPILNRSSWGGVPVFRGHESRPVVLSFDWRLKAMGKGGFASVDISGSNGDLKMILRPNRVNFSCQQHKPDIKRGETGFSHGALMGSPDSWKSLSLHLTGESFQLSHGGQDSDAERLSLGVLKGVRLSGAYADCEFRNVCLRYADGDDYWASQRAMRESSGLLYGDRPGMVEKIRNLSAWQSLPLLRLPGKQSFHLRFEFSLLAERNGFAQVNISGASGRRLVIFRPRSIGTALMMRDSALSTPERVFSDGSVQGVIGQWRTAEVSVKGGKVSVQCDGVVVGGCSLELSDSELELSLSATSADCDFRNIHIVP